MVGQGQVALVGADIGEGAVDAEIQAGDGPVAQGPDQHDGHLLPGDGVVRAEGVGLGGDGAVNQGGLDGLAAPEGLGHVGEAAVVVHQRPLEEAAEDGDEGPPRHGVAQAEAGGRLAPDEPRLGGAADLGGCPVLGGHVREAAGGGGGRRSGQGKRQGQGQEQGGEAPKMSHRGSLLTGRRKRRRVTIVSPL